MREKLLDLLKIHEEELSLFLWAAALLFIIRSSGIILNNYAETAFLKRYGVEYLPMVNMLNAGAVMIQGMGRSFATLIFTKKKEASDQKKTAIIEEIKRVYPLVKDSILVKIMLVLTFMPNVLIPILNYQFNYAVDEQFASESTMIQFFGNFRGVLNIVSLFILLFVGRVYGRWGLPVALMFHPFNYLLAFTAFLLRFDVFSAVYARMSTSILRTTINSPANSILIGLFPGSYRDMIRPFLRGTVVRLALLTGSALILISTPLFHPRYLSPRRHETTIAIMKYVIRHGIQYVNSSEFSDYVNSSHPVVRGFACACRYSDQPEILHKYIEDWLSRTDISFHQSGIICAGLSGDRYYIARLQDLLKKPESGPVMPDIIRALSRLQTGAGHSAALSCLEHDDRKVRMAALDALSITNADTLQKAVRMLGDPSDTIHDLAVEKIRTSDYQNHRVLVESLGLPSTKIRRGLFKLLETLDIKEFDVLMFARNNLSRAYEYLAVARSLETLSQSGVRDLAMTHLKEKKERVLENILKVLAIHDQSNAMKSAWQGIFSSDTRQRSNAIELLNDVLDKKTFKTLRPLLENPNPSEALTEGRKRIKIPEFDTSGKQVVSHLLSSADWVDVIFGLEILQVTPDIAIHKDLLRNVRQSDHPHILSEVGRIEGGKKSTQSISLAEKILLLKKIDMFSGLSVSELAAIAGVTREMTYEKNEEVIRQNRAGETVFLIIEGQVSVIMERGNGNGERIDRMTSGSVFGEMALIDDSPRSATIRTLTACRFLVLHKQEFKETAMEFPRIALQLCSVLSQRIRHLHSLVQDHTQASGGGGGGSSPFS